MAHDIEGNIIFHLINAAQSNDAEEDSNSPSNEYWTEERMKNAIQKQVIIDQPEEFEAPEAPESIETETKADITVMPFNNGGKLYFTDTSKKKPADYSATAQFVGEHQQVLLTAAHNVQDPETKVFYSNFHFVRAKNNKKEDKEKEQQVGVYACAMPCGWAGEFVKGKTNHYKYDYAFLFTTTLNSSSENLLFGLGQPGSVIAFGYPKRDNASDVMYRASGEVSWKPTPNGCVWMSNNTLGNGSSGGAWVDSDKSDAKVFGINSYTTVLPNEVYSPIFTDEFYEIYKLGIKQFLNTRYVKLSNKGGFVVRMRILYGGNRGPDEHGNVVNFPIGEFKQSGYDDICQYGERTLDLKTTGIPQGACVRLKAFVVAGHDRIAEERFIYRADSGETRSYKITGVTVAPKLRLV